MNPRQRFNLHLPGLLKVLAEHLYSSKKVGVRELIQNAHDSCVRRKIEGSDPRYRSRIDLTIDAGRRTLTISDNGTGLTEDEIVTYLATIGRGYTRELREQLAICSPEEAAELIGQFGLGFLSAFLLASSVTLTTRSMKGGPALRWQSDGDEHFTITPGQREAVGTTVELQVKPGAAFVLNETSLIETIRTYADFVPTPIHVAGDGHAVNLMTQPWEAAHPETATEDFIARTFRGTRPLWILPLHDARVSIGHDHITVPLKGFLFVPPGSVASIREFGDLRVYIRRMFICERERDLLPPWARFVRGVVESPLLQPTASREGLHQDENFELVRQALAEQLGSGLRRLATAEPNVWKQVVRGHTDVIMGWAVSDGEFFDRVEDIVTFRTSRGPLTLPEYLALSGGSLYFVTRELGSLQEQLLAEGRDVPAIDASWFAVTPFLEKYASRRPDVGLVQLDGESAQLLRPVPEADYALLLDPLRQDGVQVRMASFKPTTVPALMIYPQGAELAREAEAAVEADELPGPLDALIRAYIDQKYEDRDELRGTLYLNASCPLVRRLTDRALKPEARLAVLTMLHQVARLFAGRMISAGEAGASFGQFGSALEALLPS